MKKSELRKIIRESLNELMKEAQDMEPSDKFQHVTGGCPPCPSDYPCCYSLGSTTPGGYCDKCDAEDIGKEGERIIKPNRKPITNQARNKVMGSRKFKSPRDNRPR